jgi:hypothetical protein
MPTSWSTRWSSSSMTSGEPCPPSSSCASSSVIRASRAATLRCDAAAPGAGIDVETASGGRRAGVTWKWASSSGSQRGHPSGGRGHAGSGFHPGGGTHPGGGVGQFGGGLNLTVTYAPARRERCQQAPSRTETSIRMRRDTQVSPAGRLWTGQSRQTSRGQRPLSPVARSRSDL